MINRTVLQPVEVANLFAAVWQYNQLGPISNVYFYDSSGKAIELGCVEVMYEAGGLAVRTVPEKQPESAEDVVRRFSQLQFSQTALNPRLVPPPATAEELAAMVKEPGES